MAGQLLNEKFHLRRFLNMNTFSELGTQMRTQAVISFILPQPPPHCAGGAPALFSDTARRNRPSRTSVSFQAGWPLPHPWPRSQHRPRPHPTRLRTLRHRPSSPHHRHHKITTTTAIEVLTTFWPKVHLSPQV